MMYASKYMFFKFVSLYLLRLLFRAIFKELVK